MSAPRTIESKSAFAQRRSVSAGRVSQWIGEGKIPAAALVGTGPSAQIDVEIAEQHLDRVLHPGQRLARAQQLLQASLPVDDTPEAASQGSGQARDMALRLQELKLEEAEDARQERLRRRLREAGELMAAEEARRAWAKQLAELVRAIDAWLPDLGRTLAVELGVDAKLVTVRLRQEWRAFRLRLVAAAEVQAAEEVELVEAEAVKTPNPAVQEAAA